MFGSQAAGHILESASEGELRVGDFIRPARDFEFGQNFVELTEKHLAQGKPLTRDALAAIEAESRQAAPANPFVNREFDAVRAANPTGKFSIASTAESVLDATKAITDKFDKDRTIVVLGRDMNPFASTLRANGRNTIDFHLSRLQYTDETAAVRWKLEIPPNAVVINTGVYGSVLDTIRDFDPTIEGYLLESLGNYPELSSSSDILNKLENFPKLTNRCSGYTSLGGAMCRLSTASSDSDDILTPSFRAIESNRSLLQNLGLSDWWVWRYENFTGTTISERLGITTPSRIQQHLKFVADRRAAS